MIKLKLMLGQWLANVTRKLKNNFYIYLATLFTLLVLLDAGVFHVGENMRDKAFDFMVKNRVIQPKADPDIVIVDINEASLANAAKLASLISTITMSLSATGLITRFFTIKSNALSRIFSPT